jgi:hypothetical protein
MNEQIRLFLDQLDAELAAHARAGEHLDLYHIGRSALVLDYGALLTTRDFDFVQMRESELEAKALELFGKDTPNAERLGLYLDPVPQALPPLPQWFRKRCRQAGGSWKVLRLCRLEPHDLATTKLKSFRPQDRQDLQFLCDQGLLDPTALRSSVESAFTWVMEKDGDPAREAAFAHLETVKDYLEGKRRFI